MCGIAGWIDRGSADPELLGKMADTLTHRGPDGKGSFFTHTRDEHYTIAFAHQRLAIIDLVTGAQPMRSKDGRFTITFNGEIYNYKDLRTELQALGHSFTTTSDTEVILHAYQQWGAACVTHLHGMFAFALWDSEHEQLLLARDRFGEKPLYFAHGHGALVFASEIKALLAHSSVKAELDHESVLDYLGYRYVPAPHTLFKHIQKLPPGSYAIWKNGTLASHIYYLPPDGTTHPAVGTPLAAHFLSALGSSVEARMMSDVPFGAFLSGGIDSSAIVALMSRHGTLPINTFSVGFEEETHSELHYARMVAQHFHTKHHELIVKADDIMTHLPAMITKRDAPVAEPSDIPIYMLSVEAAKSVKMVLTGEGADEILGGYPKHRFEPYARVYQRIFPAWLHDRLVQPLTDTLPAHQWRMRTVLTCFGLRDDKERLPRWFGAMSPRERGQLVALMTENRAANTRPFATNAKQSALRKLLYFDQTSWLPDNLLERGDRMAMAASLEARTPFLDHALVETVSHYPDNARTGKRLLRSAMKGVLPPQILARPKMGFRVPVEEWLRTTLKEFVHDHLLGADSITRHFYHPAVLEKILNDHASTQANHEKLIWTLLGLELFQRQYRLS